MLSRGSYASPSMQEAIKSRCTLTCPQTFKVDCVTDVYQSCHALYSPHAERLRDDRWKMRIYKDCRYMALKMEFSAVSVSIRIAPASTLQLLPRHTGNHR